MKPPTRRLAFFCAGLAAFVALVVWWRAGREPQSAVARAAVDVFAKAIPPTLLPPQPDNGQPVPAWRRFLAADGSPQEDLVSLQDMVATFVQLVPPERRPTLGFDTDLARVLSNAELLGDAALPATHSALRDGRLIDRWGNPWLVHPMASDLIQVRSAGPDGKLFTADDLVAPEPGRDEQN